MRTCMCGACLVIWIAEVLDFCLGEFSHAEQAGSRCDLVAVGAAYLRCGKRQLAAIVVKQLPALETTHSKTRQHSSRAAC